VSTARPAAVTASFHRPRFYCAPYFLRLTFPHRLVEDGRDVAIGGEVIT
jgi:hypothetical protein